jgi:hypothetical protein
MNLLLATMVGLSSTLVVEPRPSFDITVSRKAKGDEHMPDFTAKAHLLEDLVSFLDFDMEETSPDDIAEALVNIPHNITTDIASGSKDTDNWVRKYMGPTECVDYAPTYLFTFDRADIIEEFGSEYFLLRPSEYSIDRFIPTAGATTTFSNQPSAGFSQSKRLRQWLHTPKTGSSLEPTAKNLGYPQNSHEPCPPGTDCEMIALFREPSQRLISWFYFSTPVFEHCEMPKLKKATYQQYKQSLQLCFDNFLKSNIYDGSDSTTMFWGCQAKMLVGYHCDEAYVPQQLRSNENLTEAALAKMKDEETFKFIGNTDFYDASITLAHQMLGGELDLRNGFRKVNTRTQNEPERLVSGNRELDSLQYDSDFLCENNKYCENLPDQAVYHEVKRSMLSNILKHHDNAVRFSGKSIYYFNQEELNENLNDKTCNSPSYAAKIRKLNKFIF